MGLQPSHYFLAAKMMASFSLETTLELTQAMSWLPHIHSGEEQLRLAWTFASLKHRLDSTVDWLAAKTRRKQCKICSSALKTRVRSLLYWFAGARRCWGGGSGATRSLQKTVKSCFCSEFHWSFAIWAWKFDYLVFCLNIWLLKARNSAIFAWIWTGVNWNRAILHIST